MTKIHYLGSKFFLFFYLILSGIGIYGTSSGFDIYSFLGIFLVWLPFLVLLLLKNVVFQRQDTIFFYRLHGKWFAPLFLAFLGLGLISAVLVLMRGIEYIKQPWPRDVGQQAHLLKEIGMNTHII